MSFLDTFNHEQDTVSNNPSTDSYVALPSGWFPASSRILLSSAGNVGIFSGVLQVFFLPTASSAGGSLTYAFSQPQSLQFLQTLVFSNSVVIPGSVGGNVTININVFADSLEIAMFSRTLTNPTTPTNLTIGISQPPSALVNQLIFNITVNGPSAEPPGSFGYNFGPLSSTFLCVAPGSLIQTTQGWQKIETLQRGEEVLDEEGRRLRIARVIREEIWAQQQMELVSLAPSSLGKDLPRQRTLLCGEHYLLYQGKRYIAKSFLPFSGVQLKKGQAKDLIEPDNAGRYFMYDLQFDEEASYVVSGLVSQSRSPYCQKSPLPKELYFQPENYREERVPNTLRKDPPISFNYLLPDGREIESLLKISQRE